MRETSLDDFLGESDDEEGTSTAGEDDGEGETIAGEDDRGDKTTAGEDDGSSDGEDGPDGTGEPSGEETTAEGSIEPATAIYAWTSGGAPCADCGTTVERRWQDDGRLVCADCKDW